MILVLLSLEKPCSSTLFFFFFSRCASVTLYAIWDRPIGSIKKKCVQQKIYKKLALTFQDCTCRTKGSKARSGRRMLSLKVWKNPWQRWQPLNLKPRPLCGARWRYVCGVTGDRDPEWFWKLSIWWVSDIVEPEDIENTEHHIEPRSLVIACQRWNLKNSQFP